MVETVFMLIAYVAFSIAFERVRVGAIVGLLVAGALVGPHGLGLVHHVEMVEALAEFGIMFLLFTIGLEIKLDRLRLYGARTYILAIAQLVVTAAAAAVVAAWLGADTKAAIIIGMALSFSSTALVLEVLADLGRTLTQLGRVAIAILLIQDIGVGPALIALESIAPAGAEESAVLVTLMRTITVLVVVGAFGRFVLPMLLRQVSDMQKEELFLAFVLAVVLAASFAFEEAGASAAIGAFLVGLLMADTPYRHQIAADIAPFRGLLVGVFFMAVGMRTDPQLMLDRAGVVLLAATAIVAGKAILLFAMARALGYSTWLSAQLGVLLSQGSEFSFILLAAAALAGLMPHEIVDMLIAAVTLSMAIISVATGASRRMLDRMEGQAIASPSELEREATEYRDHVVVIGFGQVGMALTRHLLSLGMTALVIDYNARRVRSTRLIGLPVYYGNAQRPELLRSCRIDDARLVVVALSDDDVAGRVVELLRRLFPKVRILVRASAETKAADLLKAGADGVVPDGLTTALDLAERAIIMYDAPARGTGQAEGEPL